MLFRKQQCSTGQCNITGQCRKVNDSAELRRIMQDRVMSSPTAQWHAHAPLDFVLIYSYSCTRWRGNLKGLSNKRNKLTISAPLPLIKTFMIGNPFSKVHLYGHSLVSTFKALEKLLKGKSAPTSLSPKKCIVATLCKNKICLKGQCHEKSC